MPITLVSSGLCSPTAAGVAAGRKQAQHREPQPPLRSSTPVNCEEAVFAMQAEPAIRIARLLPNQPSDVTFVVRWGELSPVISGTVSLQRPLMALVIALVHDGFRTTAGRFQAGDLLHRSVSAILIGRFQSRVPSTKRRAAAALRHPQLAILYRHKYTSGSSTLKSHELIRSGRQTLPAVRRQSIGRRRSAGGPVW
jgi:hypothetical protein